MLWWDTPEAHGLTEGGGGGQSLYCPRIRIKSKRGD